MIPVLNGMKYLPALVDTIPERRQEVEYIFVDNMSNDGSLHYLKCLAAHRPDFRVTICMTKGIAEALNFGISHSINDLIVRMDADDMFMDGRLQVLADFYIQKNSDRVIVGSDAILIDHKGSLRGYLSYPNGERAISKQLHRGTPFAHPTVMFSKKLWEEVGGYPTGTSPAEDYAFWSKAKYLGAIFFNIPKPLLFYRIHPDNSTKTYSKERLLSVRETRVLYYIDKKESEMLEALFVERNSKFQALARFKGIETLKTRASIFELISRLRTENDFMSYTLKLMYVIFFKLNPKAVYEVMLIFLEDQVRGTRNRLIFYSFLYTAREKATRRKNNIFRKGGLYYVGVADTSGSSS